MKPLIGVIVNTLYVLILVESVNSYSPMTIQKVRKVLGIEDGPVPQFELVRISLSDIDKMGKNEPLTLVFNAFHLKFEINLKPVEAQETLIGKFTPIWIARSDRIAAQSVFFSPERSVMKNLGNFTRYHDIETLSAVTIFHNSSYDHIKGLIYERYFIQSLPEEILRHVKLENGIKFREMLYIVYKTDYLTEGSSSVPHLTRNLLMKKDSLDILQIYPKILITLEYNSIRGKTDVELVRFLIQFWNCLDMIFRQIERPSILLHIAGIIIPRDTLATPYLQLDPNDPNNILAYDSSEDLMKFMRDAHKTRRFTSKNQDVTFSMISKRRLCFLAGSSYPAEVCNEMKGGIKYRMGSGDSAVAFVKYNHQFFGIRTTAIHIALTMGIKRDFVSGFIMTQFGNLNNTLLWSDKSKLAFTKICQTNNTCPYASTTKTDHRELKHSNYDWMSLDGQCNNIAKYYRTACERNRCQLHCADKYGVCKRILGPPVFPGTSCAPGKYCINQECVKL